MKSTVIAGIFAMEVMAWTALLVAAGGAPGAATARLCTCAGQAVGQTARSSHTRQAIAQGRRESEGDAQ